MIIYDEAPEEITREKWDNLVIRLSKLQDLTASMFGTLDFYGLMFKCPKCGTYHSPDHRCFNCGFDHTAQD